jgi:hypothetical protein
VPRPTDRKNGKQMPDDRGRGFPDHLPDGGDVARYQCRGEPFALLHIEPNLWQLRDGDSTTLGTLSQLDDGTWRFTGNPHWEVPNLDAPTWRPILAFASVTILGGWD